MLRHSINKLMMIVLLTLFSIYSYAQSTEVNKTISKSKNNIQNLQINEISDLQKVWTDFLKTRNNKYLIIILDFINQDKPLLICAFEFNNRKQLGEIRKYLSGSPQEKEQLSDIYTAIEKNYPKNTQAMLHKFYVVAYGLETLDASRQQDKTINKQIMDVIAKHPNLDYIKKIKRAIG